MSGGAQGKGRTTQQERFAQLIVQGDIPLIECHRQAYPDAKSSERTRGRHAMALQKHPKVVARVAELRAKVERLIVYRLADAMREAEEARELAMAAPRGAAAAVAAVSLKAQLNGLLVKERANDRSPFSDVTDDQLDAAAATLRAILNAQSVRPGEVEATADEPAKALPAIPEAG